MAMQEVILAGYPVHPRQIPKNYEQERTWHWSSLQTVWKRVRGIKTNSGNVSYKKDINENIVDLKKWLR